MLRSLLAEFDLVMVSTREEAERMIIEDGIDLFVIGVHFDESRAIEMIGTIRNSKNHRKTPIIVIRLLATALAESLLATATNLIKVGAISDYVEMEGKADGEERLLQSIKSHLPAKKHK